MHTIEPFYNWRHLYVSEEDKFSPFFAREYSEFEFINTVFNYYIHPQWDEFDSRTLYLKVLIADYQEHYAIIELIGEWNDAIENDIMNFKRQVIEKFEAHGIYKFIIIAENVFNFHSGEKDYYIEMQEELSAENGWIVCLNFLQHNAQEVINARLHKYIYLHTIDNWRTYKPHHLLKKIEEDFSKSTLGYLFFD